MDADFVTFGDDALLFLGMQQRGHRWDVECGLHAMPEPWAGLAGRMDPPPDHGEESYRGSGRLAVEKR
jgi:hypothetical protein